MLPQVGLKRDFDWSKREQNSKNVCLIKLNSLQSCAKDLIVLKPSKQWDMYVVNIRNQFGISNGETSSRNWFDQYYCSLWQLTSQKWSIFVTNRLSWKNIGDLELKRSTYGRIAIWEFIIFFGLQASITTFSHLLSYFPK